MSNFKKVNKLYLTFSLQCTFHFSEMECALSAVVTNAPIRLNASKDPNIIWIFNEPKAVLSFVCHSQCPWGRIECLKGAGWLDCWIIGLSTTIQIAKYFVYGRIWHFDWSYNNTMVITYLKVDRDLDDVDAHGNHMTSGGAVVPGSTDSLTLYWVDIKW